MALTKVNIKSSVYIRALKCSIGLRKVIWPMDARLIITEREEERIDNYIIDDVRPLYNFALCAYPLRSVQDLKKILVDSLPPGTHLTVSSLQVV